MPALNQFSESGLLELWARSNSHQQVVDSLRYYGFSANPGQVRRRVRVLLKKRLLLPIGRTPTERDYRRIKAQMFADWQNMEIL